MWRRVGLAGTDVSEERVASIFTVFAPRTQRCHKPEDGILYSHRIENLLYWVVLSSFLVKIDTFNFTRIVISFLYREVSKWIPFVSSFTSRPTSLLASITVSVFLFMISMLSPSRFTYRGTAADLKSWSVSFVRLIICNWTSKNSLKTSYSLTPQNIFKYTQRHEHVHVCENICAHRHAFLPQGVYRICRLSQI
jgi:hypothetical protein